MRRPFAFWPHLVFGSIHRQVWVFLVRSSSRAIRLFFFEDLMIENKIDKAMKPIPVPYEEFESFPKQVEEFFDLIARRPFELLEKRPFLLGREFENLFEPEPELTRPIYLKLYETGETLVARAEVPGFTETELNIVAEPWRLVITGKREWKEEGKVEQKNELPPHTERMHTSMGPSSFRWKSSQKE
jgi:HSP20 family molecular chaperone IbpA